MAEHDWAALHTALEQATGSWSRDELVVLLRDLIREYVVERGLPTATPAQAAGPDLASMEFPEQIAWLKRQNVAPEWSLFTLDGRRVIVDLEGPREVRLPDRRAGATPAPAAPRAAAPAPGRAPTPRPAPAVPPRPEAEPAADEGSPETPRRKLSKGFRGLEFD